ncbi:MAG: isoleucine--tRNA ligase [Candidatus Omnitrophota bacterium]
MSEYKKTLNLPKTDFSMKANLPVKEAAILKGWGEKKLYDLIRKKRSGADRFILHDGPPYANGNIHMGHALNKILKDIVVRYKTMAGFDSPYVPGWDCHGLPVEHQLFKELGKGTGDIEQVEFREKAYAYAMRYVGIQREQFERIGVLGDWEKPYLTLQKKYEAGIVRSFGKLIEKGYIYRDLKPVNWCATCETALAEAEVEYENKRSPSIYVKFALADSGKNPAFSGIPENAAVYFVIWTTTPWTLVSNVAIALHPEYEYAIVSCRQADRDEYYVLANILVESVMKAIGAADYRIVNKVKGRSLERVVCRHPFLERDSGVVLGEFVSTEEGVGCVHIAPGHGQEDYLVGKTYGLPTIMPVDPQGAFDGSCGDLAGKSIDAANNIILEKLTERRALLRSGEVTHSYPHCWRCKKPIIFRATEQYFMNVDHDGLRKNVMRVIRSSVRWIPEQSVERIASMVENRPDWCLSRQRYWGVPIIAFKCVSCKHVLLDSAIVEHVAGLVEREGSNVWFIRKPAELVPEGTKCPKCGSADLAKETDIVDVWFESGVSHQAVLKASKDLEYPCGLYLEGSDQHRGWFQSSIITAIAIDSISPFKAVLTHGFVVDGDGKKMSKSLGNVISPFDIMKKYGADILRLWVASSDYAEDVRVSDEILTRLADAYRKMRNTYRYLLSNLYDFSVEEHEIKLDDLLEIDRWILAKTAKLIGDVTELYENYAFHRIFREVYSFCVNEISSLYLDILKDRMYTFRADSVERRSAQTAIFHILKTLIKIMAPIMVYTADEAWHYLKENDKEQSVHLASWPEPGLYKTWRDQALEEKWGKLTALRGSVMKQLEEERKKGSIGSPLEAQVVLRTNDEELVRLIQDAADLLPAIFIVSQVCLREEPARTDAGAGMKIEIIVETAKGTKCQRCWNYRENIGNNSEHPTLCDRCVAAVV